MDAKSHMKCEVVWDIDFLLSDLILHIEEVAFYHSYQYQTNSTSEFVVYTSTILGATTQSRVIKNLEEVLYT